MASLWGRLASTLRTVHSHLISCHNHKTHLCKCCISPSPHWVDCAPSSSFLQSLNFLTLKEVNIVLVSIDIDEDYMTFTLHSAKTCYNTSLCFVLCACTTLLWKFVKVFLWTQPCPFGTAPSFSNSLAENPAAYWVVREVSVVLSLLIFLYKQNCISTRLINLELALTPSGAAAANLRVYVGRIF